MNDLKYSSVWDLQLYLKLLIRGEYLTKRMENVLWEYTMAVQQRLRIIVWGNFHFWWLLVLALTTLQSTNPHGPHQKKTTGACWTLDAVSWQCLTAFCEYCHLVLDKYLKAFSVSPLSIQPTGNALWLFCSLHQKTASRTAPSDHAAEAILMMSKNGFSCVSDEWKKHRDKCIVFTGAYFER
jgi:hypothetical protein